ncbi:MAG: class I SAM-dependent methyltransferase [Myxococcota bacterium]
MSTKKTLALTDALYPYFHEVSVRESPVLKRLREETSRLPEGVMQVAPEQGQFMALLSSLMGARRVLEVGVFTGYSALCIAETLPDDGVLVACDVSEEWTAIAQRYWEEAGVASRIELKLAPAMDTLSTLLASGDAGTYDLAFVDADKTEYPRYYEALLELVRPGGLIMVDNVLWGGSVIDPEKNDESTEAIRAFNRMIHGDERVDLSLVPIGDGVTLARKRPV